MVSVVYGSLDGQPFRSSAALVPEVLQYAKMSADQKKLLDVFKTYLQLYVREMGHLLGAQGVVATRLAVDASGKLTGSYEGKNCRGSEKFSRTTSWMREQGLLGSSEQAPTLWAYGNSRGDLRLLRAANKPVSCAKLGRLSRLSEFPSLNDVISGDAISGRATADG